VQTTLIANK